MPRRTTATALRANLYQVLDDVLATGEPVEISRPEGSLWIVATPPTRLRDLGAIPRRAVLACSVDDLVGTTFPWAGNEGT
ncbi:MAG: type II toxin-antitoxin system Phd/YefM family antitoxin [Deltaproteobacteria bacterium]|nr:type II toxin-antitoxin system Phd/YefM family antitoxin [Deltaproteobacteria bacterium]